MLVVESADAAAARGAAVYGSCTVEARFVDPATADGAPVDALLGALDHDECLHLVLDGSSVGEAVRGRVSAAATEHPTGLDGGCLAPVRVLLDLLAAGSPGRHAVLTAAAEGPVALARLTVTRTTDRSW
ncbi:hypothetical protein ACOBQX_01370 [Actinokineospora sp. G85]|uniref:hypothetical protein n=1 Tax=Actinokineospora sp. G85 TaxID=3406626 RepID=UPI003C783159